MVLEPERKLLLSYMSDLTEYKVIPDLVFGYNIDKIYQLKNLREDFDLMFSNLGESGEEKVMFVRNLKNLPTSFYATIHTSLAYLENEKLTVGDGCFVKSKMNFYEPENMMQFKLLQVGIGYIILDKTKYEATILPFMDLGVYEVKPVTLKEALNKLEEKIIKDIYNKEPVVVEEPKYVDYRILET